jgi:transcriptional regulator with XRE-family HTH domain
VALPFRKQPLSKYLVVREMTQAQLAEMIGSTPARVGNICKGRQYPSPDEIAAIEAIFAPFPIAALLDKELLAYRNGPWPVPAGRYAGRARPESGEAQS